MITRDQARTCAEFMLDEDPWELVLPYQVAATLSYYERSRSLSAVMGLVTELEEWLLQDREACVALLGPGLGLET